MYSNISRPPSPPADSQSADKRHLPRSEVREHPLIPFTLKVLDNRKSTGERVTSQPLGFSDPLSQAASELLLDPLSRSASTFDSPTHDDLDGGTSSTPSTTTSAASARHLWNAKRSLILSHFTTAEKLSIVTSYLAGAEQAANASSNPIAERVRHQFEQLDDVDDRAVVHHMFDLTQHEYVSKIEQLNVELAAAWGGNQRVRALKIAIQCAKLLSDTAVLPFYPSQFVHITDILDNFGELVFQRLRTKVAQPQLPVDFTPDMVSEGAKETCENWFHKISTIRELLPRCYLELSILRCYRFLSTTAIDAALQRLTHTIRGIGNPLVGAYLRCYLCHVGMVVSKERSYVKGNLDEMLFVYHQMFSGCIRAEISKQRLDIVEYVAIYQPALDWIMQLIAAHDPEMLDTVIVECQKQKNSGPLINSILASFRPPQIAQRATWFVNTIVNCTSDGITAATLLGSLATALNKCPPPADQVAHVLAEVWRIVCTLTSNAEYLQAIESWSPYISKHFTLPEVNQLLGAIVDRMSTHRTYEAHYAELKSILERLFKHTCDFAGLLSLEHFLHFIDLFQKESVRLDVCKFVLLECDQRSGEAIADPVVINALMYVSRAVGDSVNELTLHDERRYIVLLVSAFVRRCSYGNDIEQQLAFYVDVRSAFPNLDGLFPTLVHCVNLLSLHAHSRRQRLNRTAGAPSKLAAFNRACAAYCFITIPSIAAIGAQMQLYLLCGQVALQTGCLGQADACFEAALNVVAELAATMSTNSTTNGSAQQFSDGAVSDDPRISVGPLVAYLRSFLSTLLVVPDSSARGVLYLTRKLIECADALPVEAATAAEVGQIYLGALDMLAAAGRPVYPYGVRDVVANDEMYGGDAKFVRELEVIGWQCVETGLLGLLKCLGEARASRAQAALAMEMLRRIVVRQDVVEERVTELARNLWSLVVRLRAVDGVVMEQMLARVQRLRDRAVEPGQKKALEDLTSAMAKKLADNGVRRT